MGLLDGTAEVIGLAEAAILAKALCLREDQIHKGRFGGR